MKRFAISGHNHVTVVVPVHSTSDLIPQSWSVRVLVVWEDGGEPQPFWPLYDYMIDSWSKSASWQTKTARAVGLFWDYLCGCHRRNPEHFLQTASFSTSLKAFINALLQGTVSSGADELGLFWLSQPASEIRQIRDAVQRFATWAADSRKAEAGALLPSRRSPTRVRRPTHLSAARRNRSLLSYLGEGHKNRVSIPGLEGVGEGSEGRAVSFPAAMVEEVLWEGFRRPGGKRGTWDGYYVRDMMIFLLQAYAGAREHEPLHLWVVDVIENPEKAAEASVVLFHPTVGLAFVDDLSGGQVATDRKTRLRSVYGLPPRTLGHGSYRVGWKRSKTIGREHFAFLYWSDPLASMLFLELYRYYVGFRAQIMVRRRALGLPDHPFLFVSAQENRSSMDGHKFVGAPASIQSYERSLCRAVIRCGLRYSKGDGTTSHGARHLYAYTLRKLGLPRVILQEGLRHRSPFSSDRYGLPNPMQVSEDIRAAIEAGEAKLADGPRLARTYAFIADKHPEYFGGAL